MTFKRTRRSQDLRRVAANGVTHAMYWVEKSGLARINEPVSTPNRSHPKGHEIGLRRTAREYRPIAMAGATFIR
jgi:hypothetical protein